MQYVVIAYDFTDEKAWDRRLTARPEHAKLVESKYKAGEFLYGGGIQNDSGKSIGSVIIVDFPTKEDLDNWLKVEPFVVGKVWERIDIQPFRVGNVFMERIPK